MGSGSRARQCPHPHIAPQAAGPVCPCNSQNCPETGHLTIMSSLKHSDLKRSLQGREGEPPEKIICSQAQLLGPSLLKLRTFSKHIDTKRGRPSGSQQPGMRVGQKPSSGWAVQTGQKAVEALTSPSVLQEGSVRRAGWGGRELSCRPGSRTGMGLGGAEVRWSRRYCGAARLPR